MLQTPVKRHSRTKEVNRSVLIPKFARIIRVDGDRNAQTEKDRSSRQPQIDSSRTGCYHVGNRTQLKAPTYAQGLYLNVLSDVQTMPYTNRSCLQRLLDVVVAMVSGVTCMVALLEPEFRVVR